MRSSQAFLIKIISVDDDRRRRAAHGGYPVVKGLGSLENGTELYPLIHLGLDHKPAGILYSLISNIPLCFHYLLLSLLSSR